MEKLGVNFPLNYINKVDSFNNRKYFLLNIYVKKTRHLYHVLDLSTKHYTIFGSNLKSISSSWC